MVLFYVDALDLEFHAAKLDNIMLLELVLLFSVAVGDVSDNEVYLLESVARVLELLTRLRVLLVHVLRHELFLLFFAHFSDLLDLGWLYEVVVPDFLDIEKQLGFAAELLL